LELPDLQEVVGRRQGKDETGADGLDVEGGALRDAQLCLNADGRRRKRAVGGGGGADDEVDVDGIDAGADQSLPRCGDAEVGCQLAVGRNVASPDAGALANPLVARVDDLGQIGVGQHAFRQIGADAADNGSDDSQIAPLPFALWACRLGPGRGFFHEDTALVVTGALLLDYRVELAVERDQICGQPG